MTPNRKVKTCECGCGLPVSETARFRVGHYIRTISTADRRKRVRAMVKALNPEEQSRRSKLHWNKTTVAERFWNQVDKSGDCWFRTGSKEGWYDGERHRKAWRLTYGPIPNGLCVLHHCDNPRCTRPDHLFLGNHSDNAKDMVAKGRHARKHKIDQKGEANNGAKLTTKLVRYAKRLLAQGFRQCEVMKRTGITRQNIHVIAKGLTWTHVKV